MNKENSMWKMFSIILMMACTGNFTACAKESKITAKPVENFKIERYLGDWYEIGRFDFKWEKDMKNVRANYSLNSDGTIKVTNSGYNYVSRKEKQSIGKAKFATSKKDVGNLKVSFFGPFYSAYKVIVLDSNYQYALVAGANNKLLWILSRTPTIPENVKENYIQIAKSAGYDFSDFVWTIQE
ncbi:MAG: lipocalin family protein [Treponema sp.]|nr:lipocalin family protein [Treponema sp.]